MLRIPPTTDKRAKVACYEVAQQIAGENPPAWFLNYLEEQVSLLAGHRYADDERIKEKYKSCLNTFSRRVKQLKEDLSDPILIGLLKEKKWQHEAQVLRDHLDESALEENLPEVLKQARGDTFYEEHLKLSDLISDFIGYADFAIEMPELQGKGRGHVYLRGNVSPKQMCAFVILVARHYFGAKPLSGRAAYLNTQHLWIGAESALKSSVVLQDETSQYASDKLSRWRPYFDKDKRQLHFSALEDCRLRFLSAAFRRSESIMAPSLVPVAQSESGAD